MSLDKLREYLDSNKVKYVTISHSPAYTAQEVAQAAHISGQEMVKTVIVKVDGDLKMLVLPATEKVDFDALKKILKANKVELASEYEFNNRFPDCELGAMPPFGNLFGMDVLMDEHLQQNNEIAFNAGTHTELIKSTLKDFVRLVHPQTITH